MSHKERMEQTLRDLKRRQEIREQGQREAKAFIIESSIKCNRRRRTAKNRGCRSCK